MFDLTTLTAEAFGQEISAAYRNTFGGREPQRADFLAASARLAVERRLARQVPILVGELRGRLESGPPPLADR